MRAHNTLYLIIAYNIIKYNSLLLFVSSKSKFCHNAQPRRFSPFSPYAPTDRSFLHAGVQNCHALPHIQRQNTLNFIQSTATLIFPQKTPKFPHFYATCQIQPHSAFRTDKPCSYRRGGVCPPAHFAFCIVHCAFCIKKSWVAPTFSFYR